jgi:hypothetical protein
MKKFAIAAVSAACLAFAAPAAAQDLAYTPGNYWSIGMIDVEDGQFDTYMDYLSGNWRRQLEFARQRGWISGYHILVNTHPRDGEPDLYLLTLQPRLPNPQEEVERMRLVEQHMSQTARQMEASSGERVRMRRQMGTMLLQELNLRPAR